MKPDEPNSSQGGMSLSQQGPMADTPIKQDSQSQELAAQVIRSQIDNIYAAQDNPNYTPPTSNQSVQPSIDNPYIRNHSKNPDISTNNWKQYHTAWQNYYQKYYEGYYKQHVQKAKQTPDKQTSSAQSRPHIATRNRHDYFANHVNTQNDTDNEKTFSTNPAIFDIRQEIIGKINQSATKIRKSRHFIPILSGLVVILIFLFLQYNRIIISNVVAYVSPGSIDPQNIVIDPSTEILVGPEPRLIIPKINVDVPVVYDVGNDYDSQMAAMSQGVAQFAIPGASSHPGQIGNTVIAGHSSNDLIDIGDYKFIFAQLDKLNIGDTIYANYRSKRYTYTVTKKEVVKPNEVGRLVYPTTKPLLTLLTCTPLGTATNRLLITSEQISPDTSLTTPAPTQEKPASTSIPGNSPTFFERLFSNRY